MLRTIKADEFIADDYDMVIDVRRDSDYNESDEEIPGSVWMDPTLIDQWIETIPNDQHIVVYCVRGGGVSNSIIDRLQADGFNAQFIEGGIEGLKAAGGVVDKK